LPPQSSAQHPLANGAVVSTVTEDSVDGVHCCTLTFAIVFGESIREARNTEFFFDDLGISLLDADAFFRKASEKNTSRERQSDYEDDCTADELVDVKVHSFVVDELIIEV